MRLLDKLRSQIRRKVYDKYRIIFKNLKTIFDYMPINRILK